MDTPFQFWNRRTSIRISFGRIGFKQFGFGGRLLLAFGVVAATTVAAGIVAWIAFASLSGAINQIQALHLPAVMVSAELAETGGAIISTAPQLISVQTENERAQVWAELQVLLRAMNRQTGILSGITAHKETADHLSQLINRITDNLVAVDLQVRQRLLLTEQLAEQTDRLRWIHADFLDEIDPMVEDARFNLESALDRINRSEDRNVIFDHLRVLHEETRKQEALLKVNASGNLVLGLLVRGSSAQDAETLSDTVHFHGEVASLLQKDLQHLEGVTSGISLRQLSREIIAFGQGKTGLFAIRRSQLQGLDKARRLLKRNQEIVAEFKTVLTTQIQNTRTTTAAAMKTSDLLIGRGKLMLGGAMIASLAVAGLVGWLYVGRNLVARVTALSESMRAIAAGDLRTAVPTGGSDEIATMADALLVFRDTALEVETANAQAIIDNAQVGLITTDNQGDIQFFNPTAMALFGYDDHHRPAGGFGELIADENWSLISAVFNTPNDEPDQALLMEETIGKRSDGTVFPMEISIRAFRQRQEKRFIITLYDITERKQAQSTLEKRVRERTTDLRQINEQLEREIGERRNAQAVLQAAQTELVQAGKLAALGQMAAGIAHELNQPLASIRSYTHNAGRLIEMGRIEEAGRTLRRITKLTERMADISKHLHNLARRPATELSPIDPFKALDHALALFENRIKSQQVRVILDLPPKVFTILGENVRLEQVFINLLANALDAMQTNQRRELSIAGAVVSDQGQARFTVRDTGCGMSPETLDRVFDPFFTTKEVGAGLGLGLSIAFNIVKDWGGSLNVTSAPGDGATFTLLLNIAEG